MRQEERGRAQGHLGVVLESFVQIAPLQTLASKKSGVLRSLLASVRLLPHAPAITRSLSLEPGLERVVRACHGHLENTGGARTFSAEKMLGL